MDYEPVQDKTYNKQGFRSAFTCTQYGKGSHLSCIMPIHTRCTYYLKPILDPIHQLKIFGRIEFHYVISETDESVRKGN